MGHSMHMGEMRNSYKILFEKPEGMGPLGRLRRGPKWEDNIKEIVCGGVDYIQLAQYTVL
jgi:hypothetical protein